MLQDIERKILRILGNYSVGRNRTPTIEELCIKTGRTRIAVMTVLEALAKEEYIQWDRMQPDHVTILEA